MTIANDRVAAYRDLTVPRYTSYPSSPHFHAGVNQTTYAGWLAALPADEPVSLYLHVPFCRQLCWYCGCHTRITKSDAPVQRYRDALIREIGRVADCMPGRPRLGHIHWGGGTPGILGPGGLQAVMDCIGLNFEHQSGAEIAIEIDPRHLDTPLVEAMAAAGINRVSLGVQTFDPAVQKAINRIQPYDQVERGVALCRANGIEALSFDLMYGLPHQTVASVRETAAQASSLRPSRVSVFGYAHVPWMKSHQRLIDENALPDGRERGEQFEAITATLIAAGYRHIGLDHFALPEDSMSRAFDSLTLRRNFQGYTTDPCRTLIAAGASGIGSLPQGFAGNEVAIGRYIAAIEAGGLAVTRGYVVSSQDRARASIIEQLMCTGSADAAVAAGHAGVSTDSLSDAVPQLSRMAADGLVDLDWPVVTVRAEARALVRTIASAFDAYLSIGNRRHSRAV